jgi:hypothetical protein
VRIDRSDLADGPGDAPATHPAASAPDNPDAAGKDSGSAVSGDGHPDSSSARPDSALQTERTVAYRALVDATYGQYAIDRRDAQLETLARETVIPVASRTDKGQAAEVAHNSPQASDDTAAVSLDGSTPADHDDWMRNLTLGDRDHELPAVAASTSSDTATTASSGDGSIGSGGGTEPPTGDTSPGPDGDDPEGVNGGLGELVSVNAKDRAADLLAERIDGEASVRFSNGPDNEFDAVSAEFVAQAKPAGFTLNEAFRNQAKTTFEVAMQSERTPYFQFDGPPGPGVLQTLSRYADRYGIEPVIDLTPLGGS